MRWAADIHTLQFGLAAGARTSAQQPSCPEAPSEHIEDTMPLPDTLAIILRI
jgi:hypothetical protein